MSQAGVELGRAGARAPGPACRGGCGWPTSAQDPAIHIRPGPREPSDTPAPTWWAAETTMTIALKDKDR